MMVMMMRILASYYHQMKLLFVSFSNVWPDLCLFGHNFFGSFLTFLFCSGVFVLGNKATTLCSEVNAGHLMVIMN